jgi:hypothetical protein
VMNEPSGEMEPTAQAREGHKVGRATNEGGGQSQPLYQNITRKETPPRRFMCSWSVFAVTKHPTRSP